MGQPHRTHTMRWVTRKLMFGSADVDPATLAMTHELLEEPRLSTMGSLQGVLLRHEVLDAMSALRTTWWGAIGDPRAVRLGLDDGGGRAYAFLAAGMTVAR